MTDLRFDGRVAIVTGAGQGLGKSHALLLAARGARVVVNDVGSSVTGEGSDAWPAEQLVKQITAAGGEAVADVNSVATSGGGVALVQTAMDTFGRLDIVVNNAGILRDAYFDAMTADLVQPVLDVHLNGAFNVTRPAFVIMREQGYGRVVSTDLGVGHPGLTGKKQLCGGQNRSDRLHAGPGRRRSPAQHQGQRAQPDRLHADACPLS